MELTVMEMVGFTAAHRTDEVPFRCVICEYLTRHSPEGIIPHMVGAHNLSAAELSIDHEGNVFHTPLKQWPSDDRAGSA